MISLIIPTYKNPNYLDICIKSALENSIMDETEIIVIVDGFFDMNKTVLDKYSQHSKINIISFEENHGMAMAINYGVFQSNNPWVFIINDDNVMSKEWDSRLENQILNYCQHKTKSVKTDKICFSVNQIEPTGPSMFNFVVKDFGKDINSFQYNDWLNYELELSNNSIHNDFENSGSIFPFVMLKKYYMAIGGLDLYYNSPNIVDWDFFLRLQLLEFETPRILKMHLYHFGSVSTKKNSESQSFVNREHAAIEQYIDKWGVSPHNDSGTNFKFPPDNKFRGFSA